MSIQSAVYKTQSVDNENDRMMAFESLNSLIETFKISLFVKHKARELLYEGYEDKLLSTASSLYPNQVKSNKFGWLLDKNNTDDGQYEVYTGKLKNGKDLGLVHSWNHQQKLTEWSDQEKCSSLTNTITGDLQPPFFIEQNYLLADYFHDDNLLTPPATIRLLMGDMCRAMDLEFNQTIQIDNITAYRYYLASNEFDYSTNTNKCYCQDNK